MSANRAKPVTVKQMDPENQARRCKCWDLLQNPSIRLWLALRARTLLQIHNAVSCAAVRPGRLGSNQRRESRLAYYATLETRAPTQTCPPRGFEMKNNDERPRHEPRACSCVLVGRAWRPLDVAGFFRKSPARGKGQRSNRGSELCCRGRCISSDASSRDARLYRTTLEILEPSCSKVEGDAPLRRR